MTDPPYSLLSHIGDLLGIGPGQTFTDPCFKVAHGITDDPQAHIDALVEAGVLVDNDPGMHGVFKHWYTVAAPHAHEWRVCWVGNTDTAVQVQCKNCGERTLVTNRLPIEVPDD